MIKIDRPVENLNYIRQNTEQIGNLIDLASPT